VLRGFEVTICSFTVLLVAARPHLRAGSNPWLRQGPGATSISQSEISSGQRWWKAVNALEIRVVNAHLQKSLLSAYRASHGGIASWEKMNGITFSRKLFPITLTSREEWPPVLGGCRNLMEKPNYETAIRALEPLAHSPVRNIPILQRVLVQNALWDVFDSVYQEGSHPWHSGGKFHRRRWRTLLLWLAHDISHIAVSRRALSTYCRPGVARRHVLGPRLWRRAVELYSLQQLTIHTTVLGFRRVVRVYLYDPKRNLAKLPAAQLHLYCRGAETMGTGSVAIEVEDAIAVLPGGDGLFPTRIPVIARSYRVIYSGRGNPILDFAIYRFPRSAAKVQSKDLRRLPGSFSTWTLLNLPTVPDGSTGFLAKYSVVCAQCHFPGQVQSFRSGLARPERRYFRITKKGTGFVQARTVQRKLRSTEFAELKFYCGQPLPATHGSKGSRG
jgi:hypothetical protein